MIEMEKKLINLSNEMKILRKNEEKEMNVEERKR